MDQALSPNELPILEPMPQPLKKKKKADRFPLKWQKATNDLSYAEQSDTGRSMALEKAVGRFQRARRIVESQLTTIENIKRYIEQEKATVITLKNHQNKLVIKVLQLKLAKLILERSIESKSMRNKGKEAIRALAEQELAYLERSPAGLALKYTPAELSL